MNVYTAHQITGLGYDEVMAYYTELQRRLEAVDYTVLCPMVAKEYLRDQEHLASTGYRFPASTDHAIYERDQWMVRQADIVLVDLSGAGRVVGCHYELAWASLLGKHTVLVMEPDSVHRHAFVLEAADVVFNTLEEALDYLEKLAGYGNA